MDGDLVIVAGDQHDDLEQVAGPVGPEEQPAIGVFTGIFDGQGMVDGVEDVLIGDTVPSRRAVDLHEETVLRKACLRESVVGDISWSCDTCC